MVLHGLRLPSISGPTDLPGSYDVCYLLYFLYDTLLLVTWFHVHGPPPSTGSSSPQE